MNIILHFHVYPYSLDEMNPISIVDEDPSTIKNWIDVCWALLKHSKHSSNLGGQCIKSRKLTLAATKIDAVTNARSQASVTLGSHFDFKALILNILGGYDCAVVRLFGSIIELWVFNSCEWVHRKRHPNKGTYFRLQMHQWRAIFDQGCCICIESWACALHKDPVFITSFGLCWELGHLGHDARYLVILRIKAVKNGLGQYSIQSCTTILIVCI